MTHEKVDAPGEAGHASTDAGQVGIDPELLEPG